MTSFLCLSLIVDSSVYICCAINILTSIQLKTWGKMSFLIVPSLTTTARAMRLFRIFSAIESLLSQPWKEFLVF